MYLMNLYAGLLLEEIPVLSRLSQLSQLAQLCQLWEVPLLGLLSSVALLA